MLDRRDLGVERVAWKWDREGDASRVGREGIAELKKPDGVEVAAVRPDRYGGLELAYVQRVRRTVRRGARDEAGERDVG